MKGQSLHHGMQKLFISAGTEVYTVSFTALADIKLSDVVSSNSRFTAAEAYGANGALQDVELTFSGATANTNECTIPKYSKLIQG